MDNFKSLTKLLSHRYLGRQLAKGHLENILLEVCFEEMRPVGRFCYKNLSKDRCVKVTQHGFQIIEKVKEDVKAASKTTNRTNFSKAALKTYRSVHKQVDKIKKKGTIPFDEEEANEKAELLIGNLDIIYDRFFNRKRKGR